MASLIELFEEELGLQKDLRTKDWKLVQHPWVVDVIFLLYMTTFMTYKYLRDATGQALWNHLDGAGEVRPFFAWIVDLNNLILTPMNWYLAIEMTYCMVKLGYSVFCTPLNLEVCPDSPEGIVGWILYGADKGDACVMKDLIQKYEYWVLFGMWLYVIAKLVELSDTLILAMEDRLDRRWFLHLFHHGGLLVLSWFAVAYLPTGTPAILGSVNCYAHAISYTGLLIRNNTTLPLDTQISLRNFCRFFVKIHFCIISALCAMALVVGCGLPRVCLFLLGTGTILLFAFDL